MLLDRSSRSQSDRHADEGTGNPPQKRPEEDREQDETAKSQGVPSHTRLQIAPDQELDQVQAREDDRAICQEADCAMAYRVGKTVAMRGPMTGM